MYHKGYKFRIYPNNAQKELLSKHFGCTRFIYNWGLDKKITEYEKTKTSPSCFDLIKMLPNMKKDKEWLKEVNSQSLQMSLRNLDNAFTNFFKKSHKFPNFKSKRYEQTFQVPQHWIIEDGKIKLPKIGQVRIKQHREIEGTPKTLTVKRTNTGKYFVSFNCEINKKLPLKPKKVEEEDVVGIDLGIKDFATFSTGEKVANPKYLEKSFKKLKREQKKLSRKKKGSNNRKKQKDKVAKIHERVSNQRRDFLHKLSKRIVDENQVAIIEDLDVKNMDKGFFKHRILDLGMYMFREFLEYKSDWYGTHCFKIGRFDPSSKICSNCGWKKDDLKISDREWKCENCNQLHDRDINAAKNIKNFGIAKILRMGHPKVKPVRHDFSLEKSEQEAQEL